MRRILAGVLAVLLMTGVGYAAETAAPSLGDIYKAIMELRADVATLKAGSPAKGSAAGQLATVSTPDGLVTLEVTSIMAGPDATVIGLKVTNKTADKKIGIDTTFSASIVAAGQEVKILEESGFSDPTLPGTTRKGVILAAPLPAGATDITFRTDLYDREELRTLIEPTLTLTVPK